VRATSASPASSRLSATARQRKCPEVIQHGVPGGLALSPPVVRVASSNLLPVAPDPAPHQQREGSGLVVEPHRHRRAVQDQPDDVLPGQIPAAPGVPVRLHLAPGLADHVLAHRTAQQHRQPPPHAARSGARERGRGDQRLHLPGAPGVVRQDCAAPLPLRAVRLVQPHPRHRPLHRPEGARQRPHATVPVTRRATPLIASASQRRSQLLLNQLLDPLCRSSHGCRSRWAQPRLAPGNQGG
jgi:hypothetical protein